jgi:hypothetical protein
VLAGTVVAASWCVAAAQEAPTAPEAMAVPHDEQELLDRFRRSQGRASADSAAPSPADTPPPAIKITRGPDGRLMISSQDTRALDLMEDLIAQQTPAPGQEYKIYKLKYADALDVKYLLEDFFEEEDQNNRGFFLRLLRFQCKDRKNCRSRHQVHQRFGYQQLSCRTRMREWNRRAVDQVLRSGRTARLADHATNGVLPPAICHSRNGGGA